MVGVAVVVAVVAAGVPAAAAGRLGAPGATFGFFWLGVAPGIVAALDVDAVCVPVGGTMGGEACVLEALAGTEAWLGFTAVSTSTAAGLSGSGRGLALVCDLIPVGPPRIPPIKPPSAAALATLPHLISD